MLLEDMRSEVRQRLGELTADFWTDDYIDSQLNAGAVRFCREERWDWLQAIQTGVVVAANATSIDLVDDIDSTRTFSLVYKPDTATLESQYQILQRVSPSQGWELRTRYPNAGTPLYFYVAKVVDTAGPPVTVNLQLHIVPKVQYDGTIEYLYFREQSTFTTGEEPIIPEAYQEAVVAWATGMCWLKELNGGGKAQEQFNVYQSVLQQALRDQKSQANDDILIWGGAPPQGRMLTPHDWVRTRTLPTLG